MKNKSRKFHSLSRRIVIQFCVFTLLLSSIFASLTFMLLYDLEDQFIEREVQQEANYLISEKHLNGKWPEVKSENMWLHLSKQSLPSEILDLLIQEPQRNEFYGKDKRHYHLQALKGFDNVFLLAEVSDQLLVRPVRSGYLRLFYISATILTIIAFSVAWFLGRKTAMPLKNLADLVDGVAPEKIPQVFANEFPNNEIGILAKTLEKSMQRINHAITREKNFTRDVSHELRTPATVIKNAIELYKEENTLDDRNKTIINRVEKASIQMEQTITTLLILAREEHTSAEKTSTNLLPLIEQSILDHSYLLENKKIAVKVNDNCNTKILVQKGMLRVLLDNLIGNAFQYTNLGSVKIDYSNNQLTIEDTGPGIEKGISSTVTEPAIKGSQSTGYGFGLSIVKRLCDHQGWNLKIQNHRGTIVSVAFF